MIKKISVGLLALAGVSGSAFAGHVEDVTLPAAPAAINVTAPVQQGSWSFGLEALYQQTDNSDFQYAIVEGGTDANEVNRTKTVDPDHHWGGHADVTYNFAGNGRFVTLGYTHLDTDDSNSTAVAAGNNQGPTRSFIRDPLNLGVLLPSVDGNWDTARGKQDDDYDAVDLVFGQRIDVGQRVQLKPYGGLRYADIDQRDRVTYTSLEADNTTDTATGRLKSEFEGIGPRFGVDASVKLGMGFAVTGRIAGSLLVGDLDEKASSSFVDGSNADNNTSEVHKIDSKHRVVPEADARLGLNYTHAFNNDTALGVELGYEVVNYFDVTSASATAYEDTSGLESDFGMRGPYLRVQLDVA